MLTDVYEMKELQNHPSLCKIKQHSEAANQNKPEETGPGITRLGEGGGGLVESLDDAGFFFIFLLV